MQELKGLHPYRRLICTLIDIGPRRLMLRLCYNLRQRLDRKLPAQFALSFAGCSESIPQWLLILQSFANRVPTQIPPPPCQKSPTVKFRFLNQKRHLEWPIHWNDSNRPRLWQFHLHYFDWAREWLEIAQKFGYWPTESWALEPLLDQWIANNPAGRGDGWHSYTLSLRIRNWIWLFRSCPDLATPARLKSLWQQLCWLQAHTEEYLGGNHWLENLITISIGSIQFEGTHAQKMYRRTMRLLQKELAKQILADGGHEERSTSYHLIILDRLVELACVLVSVKGIHPVWLHKAIKDMSRWCTAIRLTGGLTPRFNDSPADAAPPLDEVMEFANAYLNQRTVNPESVAIDQLGGGRATAITERRFCWQTSITNSGHPSTRANARRYHRSTFHRLDADAPWKWLGADFQVRHPMP